MVYTSSNQTATIPRTLVDEYTATPVTCFKCDSFLNSSAEGMNHWKKHHDISFIPDSKSHSKLNSRNTAFVHTNRLTDLLIKLEIEREEDGVELVKVKEEAGATNVIGKVNVKFGGCTDQGLLFQRLPGLGQQARDHHRLTEEGQAEN